MVFASSSQPIPKGRSARTSRRLYPEGRDRDTRMTEGGGVAHLPLSCRRFPGMYRPWKSPALPQRDGKGGPIGSPARIAVKQPLRDVREARLALVVIDLPDAVEDVVRPVLRGIAH